MKYTLLLLSTLFIFSCSIQKRKYQKGYYVDWHHKKTVKDNSMAEVHGTHNQTKSTTKPEEIVVSTGDKPGLVEAAKQSINDLGKKTFKFLRNPEDSCDLLLFKDGTEIKAKVEEIGINEIKYKRCDSPDGPIYVTRKSDIFMVKYSNGTKEVFKSEPVVVEEPAVPISTYRTNRYKRVNHPLALPSLITGGLSVIAGYLLGLLAITIGTMEIYLVIPLLLGIVAVALGATAMSKIRDQPDIYKGKGMALPGFIMGLVMTCIFAIVMFIYVVLYI